MRSRLGTVMAGLRARLTHRAAGGCFDALEARALLAGTPLPQLTDLESPNNTVVRFETSFGDIDIELFNTQAPITVANFLNYVTSGRFDETFFHRHAINPNPFVLQGGGFLFDDAAGLSAVQTDAPIVREDTGRSNVARTVAMARTNAINSATSQFFINYVNNTFLDPTASTNGYAVFGRVIQGWDVVTTIQALRSLDETNNPAWAGDAEASVTNELPVTDSFIQGSAITEANLVTVRNAEIIKPANVSGFFAQRLVMPEGFRSAGTIENLELFNPNSSTGTYQVIARYESGLRDTVIASGSINAGATLRIRLSDSGDPTLNLVRTGVPYALVVETALPSGATSPQAITASVNRVDYGAATGEGLFNTTGYADSALQAWDFARIERSDTSAEYLTWLNLSDQPATVTVTLQTAGGARTFTRTLDAYRRGGLALATLDTVPDGVLSARVSSTRPIVAFLSDWDLPASGQNASTAYTPAFGLWGQPGGGSTVGGLAEAVVRENFTNVLSIANFGSTVAIVTLNFWRDSRLPTEDPISRTEIVFAGGREDFALTTADLGIPAGEQFTVTYSSGSANIAVQYTSVDNVGRNQSGSKRADGVSTMFVSRLAPVTFFSDGQMDPTRTDSSETETISIFNPFADDANVFSYTVRYHFSDGTSIDAFSGTLTSRDRVTLTTQSSSAVRNKAGQNTAFRSYTVSVLAQAVNGSTTNVTSGLVQLTRTDTSTGRSITSTGAPSAFGFAFNDPIFQPGGGGGGGS
ncbi:MAG: peptidylprolyl isomerase [Planctomycetota bacterium]|nr:peptidylprolyl isomerase [Planctomycetota bacterium]